MKAALPAMLILYCIGSHFLKENPSFTPIKLEADPRRNSERANTAPWSESPSPFITQQITSGNQTGEQTFVPVGLMMSDLDISVSVPSTGENRFSVCGGERLIKIRYRNILLTDTLFDLKLQQSLPAGIAFTGTITGGAVDMPSVPSYFLIDTLIPGQLDSVTIGLEANCGAIPLVTGTATSSFNNLFTYTGGTGSQSQLSPAFEIVKPKLTMPSIKGSANPTLNIFEAGIGSKPDTFNIDLVNGGDGSLASFTYYVVEHPLLDFVQLKVKNVIVPVSYINGDTLFFTLGASEIGQAIAGPNPNDSALFQFNEKLQIKETWKTVSCPGGPIPDIQRNARYGCGAYAFCEEIIPKPTSGVRFNVYRPNFTGAGHTDNRSQCYADDSLKVQTLFRNYGTASGRNFVLRVDFATKINLNWDTAKIYYKIGINGVWTKISPFTTQAATAPVFTCDGAPPGQGFLHHFQVNTGNVEIKVNDTIYFSYQAKTYYNCYENGVSCNFAYSCYIPYFMYSDMCNSFTSPLTNSGYGRCIAASLTNSIFSPYFINSGSYVQEKYINASGIMSAKSTTDLWFPNFTYEYRYIFEEGLDWTGIDGDTNTLEWRFDLCGVSSCNWKPFDVDYTNHANGPDTLRIFLKSPITLGALDTNYVNITGDCSEIGNCGTFERSVSHELFVYPSLCYTTPIPVICKRTTLYGIYCTSDTCSGPPGPGCNGIQQSAFSIRRTSLGLPDSNNDGQYTTGETLDTSKLNLLNFVSGDTMNAHFEGKVQGHPDSTYEYGFASIDLTGTYFDVANPTRSALPLSANVTIIRGAISYSCDVVTMFYDPLNRNIIIADFSAPKLIYNSCNLPAAFKYTPGDSIVVNLAFSMRECGLLGGANAGLPVLIRSDMYLAKEPFRPSNAYRCNNGYFKDRVYHYGVEIGVDTRSTNLNGCGSFAIGGLRNNIAGSGDRFPFEIRESGRINVFTSELHDSDIEWDPEGQLIVDHSLVSQMRFSPDFVLPKHSQFVTISGKTITVDLRGATDSIYPGYEFDGGEVLYAYFPIKYGCNVQPKHPANPPGVPYPYDTRKVNLTQTLNPSMFCSGYYQTGVGASQFYHVSYPKLSVDALTNHITICEDVNCIRVDLKNTGNLASTYTYLSFLSPSGGLIVNKVTDITGGGNTVLKDSLGILQLGTVPAGATRTLEICIISNNCQQDSLIINGGWDCNKYPGSASETICNNADTIYFNPTQSELGMIVRSPLDSTGNNESFASLCDTLSYMVQISSADLGNLYNIFLRWSLPLGQEIVPGCIELGYPVRPGVDTVWLATSAPQLIYGNTYQLKITDQDTAVLKKKGLIGTKDVTRNFLLVRFKAVTTCDYASGSLVEFLAWGEDPCGAIANYRTTLAPKLKIYGVTEGVKSTINFNAALFNACKGTEDSVKVTISYAIGSQPTGPTDSARIILPIGMHYKPGSYLPVLNATVPILSPSNPRVEVVLGQEIIYIDLLEGITGGTDVKFNFAVYVTDAGKVQPCGDYKVRLETFNRQSAYCTSNMMNCVIRAIQSSAEQNFTVEKADLSLKNLEATATAVPPNSEVLDYCVDVMNMGASIDSGIATTIQFYEDANNNGSVDAGTDFLLGTAITVLAIPGGGTVKICGSLSIPSGHSCRILAYLDPDITCTCSESTSLQESVKLINSFQPDFEVCSGELIPVIGPLPLANISYQWINIGGAQLGALSDPFTTPASFNYINTTTAQIHWQYYLRQLRGGQCVSTDTVNIVINPTQRDSLVAQVCKGLDFVLPGPLGYTNYSWTPAANLSDPTLATPTVQGGISDDQVFELSYTDENGCPGYYKFSGNVLNCARTSVGNFVWKDLNKNGIQNAGEPGVPKVNVFLYQAYDTLMPYRTSLTDSAGYYGFNNIPQGEYYIRIDTAWKATLANQGMNDSLDSDFARTKNLGSKFFISFGDSLTHWDGGVLGAEVGDFVWEDLDRDGVQETGEPSIAGLEVQLYGAGLDSLIGTGDDYLVDTTTTGSNGKYLFDCLPGGCYYLKFANTSANGYFRPTLQGTGPGTGGNKDSDISPGYLSKLFCLRPEQKDTNADAGFIRYIDLELRKQITGPNGNFPPAIRKNDTLIYLVTIENIQNDSLTSFASNVIVKDSLPSCFNYISSVATKGIYNPLTKLWDIDTIPSGRTDSLWIKGIFNGGIDCENEAQAFNHYQIDIDSEPDNFMDHPLEDEEDTVIVNIFDLALRLTDDTTQCFQINTNHKYTIDIFNQGNVSATQVKIVFYKPIGLTFDPMINPGWTQSSDSLLCYTVPDTIDPGDQYSLNVQLGIEHRTQLSSFLSYAEIQSAQDTSGNVMDTLDTDSNYDNVRTNDIGAAPCEPTDDMITDDGTIDEDDHDVNEPHIFDIALRKTLKEYKSYAPGDTVTYLITLFNQGTQTLLRPEVTDSFGIQLTFDSGLNTNWVQSGDKLYYVHTDSLARGDSAIVELSLILTGTCDMLNGLFNAAEVSYIENRNGDAVGNCEFDSNPDEILTNETGITDNAIDSCCLFDEDDQDLEILLDCCIFTITCPDSIGGTFQCIADIPDPVLILEDFELLGGEITEYCDSVKLSSTILNNSASGCIGDSLIITHEYTLIDLDDTAVCRIFHLVIDTLRPGISCPPTDTIHCGSSIDPLNTGSATASDNCSGMMVNIIYYDIRQDGSCNDNFTITRTWSVSDDCGNTNSCVQTILSLDTTRPDIICPTDATVSCDASTSPSNTGIPSSSDNCTALVSNVSFNDMRSDGHCSSTYTLTRTWTASDSCGNVRTCQQTIQVQDTTPPIARCRNIAVAPALGTPYAILDGLQLNDGSSDNCNPNLRYTLDQDSLNCINPDTTYLVTLTVMDSCGNTSTCRSQVTLRDTIAPTLHCAGSMIIDALPCACSVNLLDLHPRDYYINATDNCDTQLNIIKLSPDNIDLDSVPVQGATFCYEANDQSGNRSACCFNVRFNVAGGSTMACEGKINVSLDGHCEAEIKAGAILANPSCNESNYTVEVFKMSGEKLPENRVTHSELHQELIAKVGSRCGSNSCWGKIYVEDKLAPEITCRNDTVYCGEVANILLPAITDNCGVAHLHLVNESEEKLDCTSDLIRVKKRKYYATDESGNSSKVCEASTYLKRIPLDSIKLPGNVQLICGSTYALDKQGHPSPGETGVPKFNDLAAFGDVNYYCNLLANYYDVVLDQGNCKMKLLRTWTLFELECESGSFLQGHQFIEIIDTTPPVVTDFIDSVNVSTNLSGCGSSIDLPYVNAADACSGVYSVQIDLNGQTVIQTNGGNITLSPGIHELQYRIFDDCGNAVHRKQIIQVDDHQPPVAVCDYSTAVTLADNGEAQVKAESFDNGSWDDCKISGFEARRMLPGSCGSSNNDWSREILFCCDDAAEKEILIQMRVIDASGNSSECMVRVNVQNKQIPNKTCLPDIRIECDYPIDVNNWNQFGKIVQLEKDREMILLDNRYAYQILGTPIDGIIESSCGVTFNERLDSSGINICGLGILRRVIEMHWGQGNTDSCVQQIEIYSPTQLQETDITWPLDYTTTQTCDPKGVNPESIADPRFSKPLLQETGCRLIAMSYEDELFGPLYNDGMCYKILRNWKVIDWCEFAQTQNPRLFGHTQIILIKNTLPPNIKEKLSTCRDTILCMLESSCEQASYSTSASGEDDCFDRSQLNWRYQIDYQSNGSLDVESNQNTSHFDGTLPKGTHTFRWILEDPCGNKDSCTYLITVQNCKSPTPYARTSTILTLQGVDKNGDGTADVKEAILQADHLDAGSSHPCGYRLKFSFSRDTNDTYRTYNCDSLGQRVVDWWITDLNGNTAMLTAPLFIQDNGQQVPACKSKTTATIKGEILNRDGEPIENVMVAITTNHSGLLTQTRITNYNGEYSCQDLRTGIDYWIVPTKNDDWLNGVSTADIIKIQKHILGKAVFSNALDMIAADVNKSRSITTADVAELRKLILGITEEISKNTSWRMMNEGMRFNGVENALEETLLEDCEIKDLQTDRKESFTGIKIGDLTNNARPRGFKPTKIETRSQHVLDLNVENKRLLANQVYDIDLGSHNIAAFQGFQTTIEFDPQQVEILEVIANQDINLGSEHINHLAQHRGMIPISWNGEVQASSNNKQIMRIRVRTKSDTRVSDCIRIGSSITQSLSVDKEGEEGNVQMRFYEPDPDQFILLQNEPNPWRQSTTIGMILPERGEVTLILYDATGRVYYKQVMLLEKGFNDLTIYRSDVIKPGLYYYQADYSTSTKTFKMVMVE